MTLPRRRLVMLGAFVFSWGVFVIVRLVQIQLVRHDEFVLKAQRQHERTVTLAPMRGSIRDVRGRLLAESVTAPSIYADPQSVGDPAATAEALASIAELGLSAAELETKLGRRGEFVWIARQVPDRVAERIAALRLPGIHSVDEHRRAYPKGTLAANLLGYVSIDGDGLAGVEHELDRFVQGRAAKVTLLRDAKRGTYIVGAEGSRRPIDGHHVVLTIDEVIQHAAEEALRQAGEQYRPAGGSIVVMDPADGAILAMASWPTFDPNRFGEFGPREWRNRPVQDLYEPGSTFKIVTAAAGIDAGVVTPSQVIDCELGGINVAGVRIRENAGKKFGLLTFEEALAHSSNVAIIKVGLALGRNGLYESLRRFGFGERSGIELPGEAVGILREPKRWSALSNAVISMGQEVAVTPLQLVRAVAAVANGGRLVQPHLVDRIVDAEGNTVWRPDLRSPERVISERTAAVLNEMLKTVVTRGTGVKAALPDYVVAGKTGTAQKPTRGGYSHDKVVASFVGYVPADRPRLVMLVSIDEPKGAQYGGTVAAPLFRAVAEKALRHLDVAPSVPGREIDLPAMELAAFSHDAAAGPGVTGESAVPDLRGLDARVAVARAVAAGFDVDIEGEGIVRAQSPEPGEARGTRIALSLSPAGEVMR